MYFLWCACGNLIYALKSEIRKDVWCFVEMYGDLTNFFVCSHGGFVVPNFEFSSRGSNVLEVAFLAMD